MVLIADFTPTLEPSEFAKADFHKAVALDPEMQKKIAAKG
jgi:hypothetical protein